MGNLFREVSDEPEARQIVFLSAYPDERRTVIRDN
jgi:hypothetical protein